MENTNNNMLNNYLKSFNILTDEDIQDFIQSSETRYLNKADYFIREGEICREVAFVLEGTLRSYYISEKGEEITYCITFPNNLINAYSSFITGERSPENILAISSVELVVIRKTAIDDLSLKNPNWLKFLKVIAEQQYVELEKRIFQLQKQNATKRYKELLNNQPEYIQNIPLQYLASYLGITQRHLSRIRKEISF